MQQKIVVIITWLLTLVLSTAYCALSFYTFVSVNEVDEYDPISVSKAILSSTLLSSILLIVYFVFSGFILIGRWVSHESDTGLWFGALVTATVAMFAVMLQAGTTAEAFMDKAKFWKGLPNWGSKESNLLRSNFVFAYIICGFFLLLVFVIGFCKKAFAPVPAATAPAPAKLDDTAAEAEAAASPADQKPANDDSARSVHENDAFVG